MSVDIISLDTTKITDDAREEIKKGTIKQFDTLGELGVISMLAVPKDNLESFIVGASVHNSDPEFYEVDLGQLVAFALGAMAALEAAREHIMTSDPGVIMAEAIKAFAEQQVARNKKDDMQDM